MVLVLNDCLFGKQLFVALTSICYGDVSFGMILFSTVLLSRSGNTKGSSCEAELANR